MKQLQKCKSLFNLPGFPFSSAFLTSLATSVPLKAISSQPNGKHYSVLKGVIQSFKSQCGI
jgi:hypothetical protein